MRILPDELLKEHDSALIDDPGRIVGPNADAQPPEPAIIMRDTHSMVPSFTPPSTIPVPRLGRGKAFWATRVVEGFHMSDIHMLM